MLNTFQNFIGKEYTRRSSAWRAIHRFCDRYRSQVPKGFIFDVTEMDGIFIVDGYSNKSTLAILEGIE